MCFICGSGPAPDAAPHQQLGGSNLETFEQRIPLTYFLLTVQPKRHVPIAVRPRLSPSPIALAGQ